MGHQVNFYATPTDIQELQRRIGEIEPMRVLHDRSATREARILPSLGFEENGQTLLFNFFARESDLASVLTEHVPAQGYWIVDGLRSPVVQVNGCYFDTKVLRRGRVYYVDGYYGTDKAWVEKPSSFRSWAKDVLRTTKKVLKRHGADYIGPDALAWLQRENGELVL